MDPNQNENQQRTKKLHSREFLAGLSILCIVLLIALVFLPAKSDPDAAEATNTIAAREMSEKDWSRMYTQNGDRRSTHVYDFTSTYGMLTFGTRSYASGKVLTETLIGAADLSSISTLPDGMISVILKPSTGSLKIEVGEAEEEAEAFYTFSASTYPFSQEDLLLVSYAQLGKSAIEAGREIVLVDYAWDSQGVYGESLTAKELKNLKHYVEVYCMFEEKNDGAVL